MGTRCLGFVEHLPLEESELYCWANNDDGRLGDRTTTERHSPEAIAGMSDIAQVAAGDEHTCAVTSGGDV